jgi:nucleotide-binding universal stress UspA family protein
MKGLKLLVPLDSSKNSERSIEALIGMKHKITCPITLLHVLDPDRISYKGETVTNFAMFRERARQAAEEFLAAKAALFTAEGFTVETLMKVGSPRAVICELADRGDFDLLIIGRHSDGELRNLLFGQVSNFVIHRVKSPVMVI